jgi:hypothetical protein
MSDTLELQDKNGVPILEDNLGDVLTGHEAAPKLFRIANVSSDPVMVQIYPDSSIYQKGTGDETFNSTWLSLNDFNYSHRIYCMVPVAGFVEFYVKWRPVHVARTGFKQWGLKWLIVEANTENICDGT